VQTHPKGLRCRKLIMMRVRTGFIALMSTWIAACSPLSLYNNLAPRDGGATRAARDVAYGPAPRQQLDIYRPKGATKPPVVIFIYGGSWQWGKRQDYAFLAHVFAARGYLTLVPDYRLVPQVRFPAFVEDGASVVAWAVKNAAAYGADPAQIFLIGHSAGAYNVAMLGLDGRFLKGAGVNPKIIRGVIGLAGPYDFYPFDVTATVDAFGRAPVPLATQPITFVRADAPPMLLLHGGKDKTVRPRNTLSLGDKLTATGAQVNTRIYPKLAHSGILLALTPMMRKRAPVLQDIEAFMAANTAP
jgi:acetyl esterase/lipase